MQRNVIVIGSWALFATLAWIAYLFWSSNLSVNANPDYICTKNVSNSACEITSCDPWWTDGERTCYWTRTTQVAYRHRRTACETWYTRKKMFRDTPWSSWRINADYIYATEDCQIIQQDFIKPSWETKVSY